MQNSKKKLLVTLGPASLNKKIIKSCDSFGVNLYRINLSHVALDEVSDTIKKIKRWTDTPICLDSEGAQLRNQIMKDSVVEFALRDKVKIHFHPVIGDRNNISFSPNHIGPQFLVGDEISVDFNLARLKVVERNDEFCLAVVEVGGKVGSNKAADVDRELAFAPLTEKDVSAVEIGLKLGVKNFALSFTNSGSDVEMMREICGPESNIICKIESRNGLLNLEEIFQLADEILIDRGDLSRQIPIEKIPFLQRRIISLAKKANKPVFVATNLLESMVVQKLPTRAEVNDVVSTLEMGADGLVLAAETAIGKFPEDAVKMIRALVNESERWASNGTLSDIIEN